MVRLLLLLSSLITSSSVMASVEAFAGLDLTGHWVGYVAITLFVLAYTLVIFEEKIHLRKSKPVLLAAGLIWMLIGYAYSSRHLSHAVEEAIRGTFLEYAELFFFLLVAMTYISALLERGVFEALRDWLVSRSLSYKSLFWITGILAFFISPIADNMTTALIMCAVVLAVGREQPKFIGLACINIVVGANAGGAFSPFGDITTLMVWQKGLLDFSQFFVLFLPSVVNFVVPATIMYLALPAGKPPESAREESALKHGGITILGLFLLTIVTAVSFHNFLGLPAVFGMMTGLAYLQFYGFYLRKRDHFLAEQAPPPQEENNNESFDVFDNIARAEWDTLFFFYGVIMAVGGLGFIGYLGLLSAEIYGELSLTTANIMVGLLSSVVDNIPVMFAVLTMNPDMSNTQWLLVTLTAGVGGSLLSIGSAAGVALMGQAREHYTFLTHLKWTPAIALGYFASIYVHLLINNSP